MKKQTKKEVTQPKKGNFNGKLAKLVDGSVYWVVLTGVSVASIANIR